MCFNYSPLPSNTCVVCQPPKEGGVMCPSLSPKDRYPPWMEVPHFVLCKNGCQRTGNLNGHNKDMCRLESSGDRIGRSPRVHPWVLKATLFFKSFFLRSTPRERVFYDLFRI